jgi:hypothetical protein
LQVAAVVRLPPFGSEKISVRSYHENLPQFEKQYKTVYMYGLSVGA